MDCLPSSLMTIQSPMSSTPFCTLVLFAAISLLPQSLAAQKFSPKSPGITAIEPKLSESTVIAFREVSASPDTVKATLNVRVLEKGGKTEPVQGATVLLRRDNDKMLGRVTQYDGRCLFHSTPATYTVRVQMTGLKTLEKTGVSLEAGKVYDLDILMARH